MKKIAALIFALALTVLSGCWDSREMNELGLVMAVGVDKDTGSGDFVLTVQIANAKITSQAGSTGQLKPEPVYVITTQGRTLYDAVRQLSEVSSKRIMWAHNYIIIIGESLARDSITPVIDFFTHSPENRMKTAVVVSQGNAKEYLNIKSGMEEIPAISFADIYSYSNLTSEYIETDLLSLCQEYYGEYSQPLISEVSFREAKLPVADDVSSKTVNEVAFGGAAVFKKDKMVGWLSLEDTKGIAFVLNEAQDTIVTVEEPGSPGKYASVELQNISSNIDSDIENGNPSIYISIIASGRIVEEDAPENLSIKEFKNILEGLAQDSIVNTVKMGLDKIQKEYQSDAVGFARYIHAQHNRQWENGIKQRWNEIFPQMPIMVKAKVTVLSSYTYQLPEPEIKKDQR